MTDLFVIMKKKNHENLTINTKKRKNKQKNELSMGFVVSI